ncbi:hypothetical protein [Bacillus paranthracis]|uniref:hypothetical protein n=1 Tax=Bacillus paranthracis TaxID=2026186 RepID=UPI0022E7D491|nr:hypothetical protein [Bacillus paranthracis]
MEQQMKHNSLVPASIQLLFHNEKLDIMKVLCLMNALSAESNKQRKVDELLFYYSLVNFNLIYMFEGFKDKDVEITLSSNKYFRFQTKINELLLIMSHLNFIEIKGDISKKVDELKVKLLPPGKTFFEETKSEYFKVLYEKYLYAFNSIKYSSENAKKIKEGKL